MLKNLLSVCAGAEVMSLVNSDENKTFGAVFRTPVDNSKVRAGKAAEGQPSECSA